MAKEVMLCTKCHRLPTYSDKSLAKCPFCGATHSVVALELSCLEMIDIMKVSKDDNFIIAMDKLKREDIIEFNLKMAQFKQSTPPTEQSNVPRCPTCGSTNIKKISATKRYVSTGLFGFASSNIGKNQECLDCGAKW